MLRDWSLVDWVPVELPLMSPVCDMMDISVQHHAQTLCLCTKCDHLMQHATHLLSVGIQHKKKLMLTYEMGDIDFYGSLLYLCISAILQLCTTERLYGAMILYMCVHKSYCEIDTGNSKTTPLRCDVDIFALFICKEVFILEV